MKVLIVSYSYFPELTPRAFRWTAIAEQLAYLGHSVEVVCSSNPDQAMQECINGVQIYRTGNNFRKNIKRWLFIDGSVNSTSAKGKKDNTLSIRGWIGGLLMSGYKNTIQKILWPDFAAFWYFSALNVAWQLVKKKKFDIVVTVSLPYTGHLVGLTLKRRFEIRWVVDIGDPFSFMNKTPLNNTSIFLGLNYRSESLVLNKADAIVVTTEGTRLEYLSCFPLLMQEKIVVIPPVFSTPPKEELTSPFFKVSNKIRLVFAGTLYSSIRSPSALLKLFRFLLSTPLEPRLELHFFGIINDCKSYFDSYGDLLGSKIFLHGLIGRDEVISAMKENLGNLTEYQLPSKVVEYVMLRKPVLNITKIYSDSSLSFFSGFPGVCNINEYAVVNDVRELDRISNFIANPPEISSQHIDELNKTHGIKTITESYLKLFHVTIIKDSFVI